MSIWCDCSWVSDTRFPATKRKNNFFLKKRKTENTKLSLGMLVISGNCKFIIKTFSCFDFGSSCRKTAKSTSAGNFSKTLFLKLNQGRFCDGDLSSFARRVNFSLITFRDFWH